MNEIRRQLEREFQVQPDQICPPPKVVVAAILLPSGAIETITNTEDTMGKLEYYRDNYDTEMRLKHNKMIKIVGLMIV